MSGYGLRLGFLVSLGLVEVISRLMWGYGYFRVSIKPEFVKNIYFSDACDKLPLLRYAPSSAWPQLIMSSFARVCFLNFIPYRNVDDFIV